MDRGRRALRAPPTSRHTRHVLILLLGVLAFLHLTAIVAVEGAVSAKEDIEAVVSPVPDVECQVLAAGDSGACAKGNTADAAKLRDYENEREASRVRKHYADMRRYQTEEYIIRMEEKFGKLDKANMTMRQAFRLLEEYVDASDPDMELPNIVHAFMAAEAARRDDKPDWFQLTTLLHDLGKMMFAFGEEEDGMSRRADGPQWALGGDTWVIGTPIPDSAVFPELNDLNADHRLLNGNSKNMNRTGLRNLRFAWGHDEYAYRILSDPRNGCKLPEEALQMVRLHSCYPLHSKRAYDHLLAEGDEKILDGVILFNKYDLYSKADAKIRDLDRLWPYYETLLDKYFEGGSQRLIHF